jgi:hypothetical protein
VAGNGELMVVTRVGSLSLDTSFLGAEVDAGVDPADGLLPPDKKPALRPENNPLEEDVLDADDDVLGLGGAAALVALLSPSLELEVLALMASLAARMTVVTVDAIDWGSGSKSGPENNVGATPTHATAWLIVSSAAVAVGYCLRTN